MNKISYLFIILVLFTNCSLNKNSKFWTNSKKVQNEIKDDYEEVFPIEKTLRAEFNSKLKIKLNSKPINRGCHRLRHGDGVWVAVYESVRSAGQLRHHAAVSSPWLRLEGVS